ncbi:MAG: hypothetical protein HGA49_01025 [Eubacteriaceae bacterium]|nr:hypothetical protein [Eubacteriaceae bacterium]
MKPAKRILELIEGLLIKKENWQTIPDSDLKYFYINFKKYEGVHRKLSDGTVITPGDLVGEMHVNNRVLPKVDMNNFRQFNRNIKSEFVFLGNALNSGHFQGCKAFYGRTILYPFVMKYGFEILPMGSSFLRLFLNFWDRLIYMTYTENKNTKKRVSEEVWISAEKMKKIA